MFIAHCPESNTNLSSGVVTIRQYLKEGMYVGLGGGGEFFGKVGSFEAGYEMDAVVLEDKRLIHPQEMEVEQRLERMIYLADEREVSQEAEPQSASCEKIPVSPLGLVFN